MRLSGSWINNLSAVGCALALGGTLLCAQTAKPAAPTKTSRKSTAAAGHKASKKSGQSRRTASKRGQQKIDPTRARQIQEALIREHYLNGKAAGTWDAASQKAMERFQADNGWQSKTVPDSRALIKLGLGPDHEHLLNPESAMTSQPASGTAALKDAAGSSTPPQ